VHRRLYRSDRYRSNRGRAPARRSAVILVVDPEEAVALERFERAITAAADREFGVDTAYRRELVGEPFALGSPMRMPRRIAKQSTR
jgi:hypothetical protein